VSDGFLAAGCPRYSNTDDHAAPGTPHPVTEGMDAMTKREEFWAWCGKRRSMTELLPLVSHHEETRQWHCRRELACHARRIWKTRKLFLPDDD
jgi:hypothetical protein